MGAKVSKPKQVILTKYESETFLSREEISSACQIFSSFFPGNAIPSIEYSRVPMQDLMEKLPFLKYNPFRDRISAVFSTYPSTTGDFTQYNNAGDNNRIADQNGHPHMHLSPSGRQLAATGGSWCFDDFVHFLSAFNEKAPVGLKHEVAFCIYDSDGDGYLGEQDLLSVIQRLVGHFNLDRSVQVSQGGQQSLEVGAHHYDVTSAETLKDEEYKQIVEQVFHEADLDRDRKMTLKDFTNNMAKFPDFARHFCVPSLENYI